VHLFPCGWCGDDAYGHCDEPGVFAVGCNEDFLWIAARVGDEITDVEPVAIGERGGFYRYAAVHGFGFEDVKWLVFAAADGEETGDADVVLVEEDFGGYHADGAGDGGTEGDGAEGEVGSIGLDPQDGACGAGLEGWRGADGYLVGGFGGLLVRIGKAWGIDADAGYAKGLVGGTGYRDGFLLRVLPPAWLKLIQRGAMLRVVSTEPVSWKRA
jgi:hypothetical protein